MGGHFIIPILCKHPITETREPFYETLLKMKRLSPYHLLAFVLIAFLSSCNTLEQASMHGFNSGYYKLATGQQKTQNVYADVSPEKVDVYEHTQSQVSKNVLLTIPLHPSDTLLFNRMVFKKQSLDIDITSILLKYRPSVSGAKAQLTTDFNFALYAGWRHDTYLIKSSKDPLGKHSPEIINRGYDIGFFAGPGATLISPFTTLNKRTDEYSAMILQTGVAAFIESNLASFGFTAGIDHLMNADRSVWIYTNKPWVGFIVGIALN